MEKMYAIIHRTKQVIFVVCAVGVITATFLITARFDYEDNFCDFRKAKVVNVDPRTELVVFEDEEGHLWEFYEIDYGIGDEVFLRIDSKGTTDLNDDYVKIYR